MKTFQMFGYLELIQPLPDNAIILMMYGIISDFSVVNFLALFTIHHGRDEVIRSQGDLTQGTTDH